MILVEDLVGVDDVVIVLNVAGVIVAAVAVLDVVCGVVVIGGLGQGARQEVEEQVADAGGGVARQAAAERRQRRQAGGQRGQPGLVDLGMATLPQNRTLA